MPDAAGGKVTPIPKTIVGRLAAGARVLLDDVTNAWFGPGQPVQPMAPAGTGGRKFDYAYGQNLQYTPRSEEAITFDQMRALADNLPLLRIAIETRKDQLLNSPWSIKFKDSDKNKTTRGRKVVDADIQAINDFLLFPDKENNTATWIRQLVEEMLVTDAACIYPRPTIGGDLYSLDLVDGATIKRLIDANGRTPLPPNPAYQQVLHGIPAADFTSDELMYVPRNKRVNKMYGFSPVEQIILTVNIALRREISTLNYYTEGTVPDMFIGVPKEWTSEQIKEFQDYFDFLMTGNLAERRKARFIPTDSKPYELKSPALKDQYDEWIARVICWALNVSVTPLVSQVNRATSETLTVQAKEEGLKPLQDWLKSILDTIIWRYLGRTDLEFVWENDDSTDILKLAQARSIYARNGLLSVDQLLEDMGRESIGVGNVIITATGVVPLVEAYDDAIEKIKNPPPPPPQLAPFVGGKNGKQPVPPSDVPPKGNVQPGEDNAQAKEVGKIVNAPFLKGEAHSRTEVRQSHHAHGAQAIEQRRRRWSA